MIIDIVRHAQSEGNVVRMLQGQFNTQLTEVGKLQASKLSEALDFPYDAVYSSTLDRALDTAKISTKEKHKDEIILHEGLKEMNFGNMQQISFNDFTPELSKQWENIMNQPMYKEHEGESRKEFADRISGTINNIIDRASEKNFSKILIFTHLGAIRVLFQYMLELDKPNVQNCQILKCKLMNRKVEFVKKLN